MNIFEGANSNIFIHDLQKTHAKLQTVVDELAAAKMNDDVELDDCGSVEEL